MLDQTVCEQQVINLLCGGLGVGHGSKVGRTLGHGVTLLHQGAAQHGAKLDCRGLYIAALQDDAVFLALENLQGCRAVRGSDDYLEENLDDLFRNLGVDGGVAAIDAGNGRLRSRTPARGRAAHAPRPRLGQ